jgi:predicted acylesterase/phospholipase RssA
MAKQALVISGGGCKGAFAVGVLKNLAANFPEVSFDVIVGTSTGSLIAPFAALGRIDLLEKLYTSITTDQVVTKGNVVARLLGSNSLFDATPLGNLIKQYYNDDICQQVFASGKEVFFATTCLQTGASVNFSTTETSFASDYGITKLNNQDELRRAVMASACQPVFMQPIEVKKGSVPLRQYVDGGVKEYAGIQLAIDAGAEEIYAIVLSPETRDVEEQPFNDAMGILERTIDIFTAGVGNNDVRLPAAYNKTLQYIASVQKKMLDAGLSRASIDNYFNIPFNNPLTGKKPLKIYVIRPDEPLGGGPGGLTFDPAEMKGMLAKGQNRIDDFMASLPKEPGAVA